MVNYYFIPGTYGILGNNTLNFYLCPMKHSLLTTYGITNIAPQQIIIGFKIHNYAAHVSSVILLYDYK